MSRKYLQLFLCSVKSNQRGTPTCKRELIPCLSGHRKNVFARSVEPLLCLASPVGELVLGWHMYWSTIWQFCLCGSVSSFPPHPCWFVHSMVSWVASCSFRSFLYRGPLWKYFCNKFYLRAENPNLGWQWSQKLRHKTIFKQKQDNTEQTTKQGFEGAFPNLLLRMFVASQSSCFALFEAAKDIWDATY